MNEAIENKKRIRRALLIASFAILAVLLLLQGFVDFYAEELGITVAVLFNFVGLLVLIAYTVMMEIADHLKRQINRYQMTPKRKVMICFRRGLAVLLAILLVCATVLCVIRNEYVQQGNIDGMFMIGDFEFGVSMLWYAAVIALCVLNGLLEKGFEDGVNHISEGELK